LQEKDRQHLEVLNNLILSLQPLNLAELALLKNLECGQIVPVYLEQMLKVRKEFG
jgi:hypothetical protein